MAFRPPTLNEICNIFQAQGAGPAVPNGPTQQGVACQLRYPGRTPLLITTSAGSVVVMTLVLPKGTDIRPAHTPSVAADAVEVPAGSGRFYAVLTVEDSAKGFATETRRALIRGQPAFAGWWPYPTP